MFAINASDKNVLSASLNYSVPFFSFRYSFVKKMYKRELVLRIKVEEDFRVSTGFIQFGEYWFHSVW